MMAAFMVALAMSPMPQIASSVEQLQDDFEQATVCRPIEGRHVWKGRIAFFIESYAFPNDEDAQTDVVGADAVLPADNDDETIKEFEAACAPTEQMALPSL